MTRIDYVGKTFGRLTAIKFEERKNKRTYWSFVCSCSPDILILDIQSVVRGGTRSCGCLRRELLVERSTTHGMKSHPVYKVWKSMKTRCRNKNHSDYKRYGGRGISYDPDWEKFEGFWKDIGSSYKPGFEIDRIDNNGNYCKKNCRWATHKEQVNNRECCVVLEFKGRKMNVTQWSEFLKINRHVIYDRLRIGWSVEKTLSTPNRKNNYDNN